MSSAVRGNRWCSCRTLPHVGQLGVVLDGPFVGVAHTADRIVRLHAQLHQQAGCDGPGTSQTTPAVEQHVEAEPQPVPDGLAGGLPGVLEVLFRCLSVGNRGMPPLHVPVSNRPREIVHLQIGDLFVGDQADHRSRSPVLNRVEVGVEIPLPGTGYCVAIDPTGALREADPAPAVAQGHRRDAEWVALGGSCHRHGLYSLTGFWHHRETDLCASISLARYPVS